MILFTVQQEIDGAWVNKSDPLPRAEAEAAFAALVGEGLPIRLTPSSTEDE